MEFRGRALWRAHRSYMGPPSSLPTSQVFLPAEPHVTKITMEKARPFQPRLGLRGKWAQTLRTCQGDGPPSSRETAGLCSLCPLRALPDRGGNVSICLSFSAQEEAPLSSGGAGSSEGCGCGRWHLGHLCRSPANSPQTGWLSLQRECDGSGFPVGPVPSMGGRPQVRGSGLPEGSWPPAAHRGDRRREAPVPRRRPQRCSRGPAKAAGFKEGCVGGLSQHLCLGLL